MRRGPRSGKWRTPRRRPRSSSRAAATSASPTRRAPHAPPPDRSAPGAGLTASARWQGKSSGALDREAFARTLTRYGLTLDREEADTLFAYYDKDGGARRCPRAAPARQEPPG